MRYELKHDKLAAQIYGLVSVETKARRKAENVYHLYVEIGANRLFTEVELDYLVQFLPVLRPGEDLQVLIQQSKEQLRREQKEEEARERARLEREKELVERVKVRQKRNSLIITIAAVVAAGLLVFAVRESWRAAENQRIAAEIRQNLERKDKLSEGFKQELGEILHTRGENDPVAAAAYAAELNEEFPSIFVDDRDWTLYETVELNDQVWLAENLRYAYRPGEASWAYGDDSTNAAEYGRLYTWEAAKRACPAGWRLPTELEWKKMVTLFSNVGFDNTQESSSEEAFSALVDGGFSSFDARLGGKRYASGTFGDLARSGEYWTSTEDISNENDAWLYSFNGGTQRLGSYHFSKALGISCRCVLK